jgi:1-acyl-sn-glycerol-3-phosphate acyltransferase
MDVYERKFARLKPTVMKLSRFCLFGKKVLVQGLENFPSQGPSVIVGNHIGSYKDIAVLFLMAPRQIHFTANQQIFTRSAFHALMRTHLKRHLKEFGLLLDVALRPLKVPFVNFIADNIAAVGSIPVDLLKGRSHAISKCAEFLKDGRAVVLLQGRGRINPRDSHPYTSPFRRGPAILCFNMYRTEGLEVPLIPVAMYGTHWPWVTPGTIKVQVGKPLYVSHYLGNDFSHTISRFRDAMEKRVRIMLFEMIKRHGEGKPAYRLK